MRKLAQEMSHVQGQGHKRGKGYRSKLTGQAHKLIQTGDINYT